jgi:hypothetical protein
MSASKSQRTERIDFIGDTSRYFRARLFNATPRVVGEGNGLGGIAAGQIGSNQNSRDINPHDWDSRNPNHGKSANLQASTQQNARGAVASLSLCRSLMMI